MVNNEESARDLTLALYSNWEKAVAWVWSTCTDATIDGLGTIPSIGTYSEVELAEKKYIPNTYYILDSDGSYSLSEGDFDKNTTYFEKSSDSYE
jgi:hypothetical protein